MVIGYYIGSAIGSYAGWSAAAVYAAGAVGAAIGYAAEVAMAPHTRVEGPKLGDLTVQTSSYGLPIPVLKGDTRIAGNVIWSTGKIPTTTTTESGGKGGKGGSTTLETTTYRVSFALALAEGELAGIRKLWMNGVLKWDASSDATVADVVAGTQIADGILFYPGSETQTPDPTMEAYDGVGNVPAYRGTAYLMFTDLQLADYGNQLPNVTAEVVSAGTTTAVYSGKNIHDALPNMWGNYAAPSFVDDDGWYVQQIKTQWRTVATPDVMEWFMPHTVPAEPVLLGVLPSVPIGFTDPTQISSSVLIDADERIFAGNFYDAAGTPTHGLLMAWMTTGTIRRVWLMPGSYSWGDGSVSTAAKRGNALWAIALDVAGAGHYWIVRADLATEPAQFTLVPWPTFDPGNQYATIRCSDSFVYIKAINPADSKHWLFKFDIAAGTYLDSWDVTSLWSGYQQFFVLEDDVFLNWKNAAGTAIYEFHGFGAGSVQIWPGIYSDGSYVGADDGITLAPNTFFFTASPSYHSAAKKLGTVYSSYLSHYSYPASTNPGAPSTLYAKTGIFESASVYLDDVVADICAHSGYSAADIDVTDLASDIVRGYVWSDPAGSSPRSALESLMPAYFFDCAEIDGKLVFVKRGGAIVDPPLTDDDLGASSTDTPAQKLLITRTQEIELPVKLNVSYLDPAADYQVGTQTARRIIASTDTVAEIRLPIVLSADEAKQIAEVNLYLAWVARTHFQFSTNSKFSHLTPTDLVTLQADGQTYTARITRADTGADGVIQFQAVADDPAVYSSVAIGGLIPGGQSGIAAKGATNLEILDIPILRDQDDDPGFYVAACGYTTGWPGCVVYRSADGGVTWAEAASVLTPAKIGFGGNTPLPNFTGGNVFDEISTVEVHLYAGAELASATRLAVLNGANAMLLGSEIIQFRDATLVSAGIYTLSGLLRGRRGTEWAMGSHTFGERAVLLDAATLRRIVVQTSDIGALRHYRGVTIGRTLASAQVQPYTHAAIGLEPYSPVRLRGTRDGSLNLTTTWIRRTRVGGEWRDYVDVPLGETTESYEVEIWDSAYTTLKRTIAASTPTASYTAAQQTTDFGSAQATVYTRIYQLSATTGRGYVLQGTA